MEIFKLFNKNKENSKNIAKERLKLVLVQDRADISPKILDMIKSDIVRTISEYADIDNEGIDIKLTRMRKEGNKAPVSALVANIPIIKIKDKR
ncbi:cell division topological specificity factor MinE [Paratissierella segnis]|uniref:Cell division topological specificity factor n=1 Tax=Paratissierella segnis TaxID=2763679 RepID=A0A926ILN4_9FIRM|nr:cell division topological specificity factor MinE [Paratissierella segnis]MBC8588838.1 cell division topological specificity factor MinE [Paratissierella segnis]